MTIDRLKSLVNSDFEAVTALITEKIQSQISLADNLSQHLLLSGGKRLRPLLVLLAAHACNYEGREHIILAAMIEFLHAATLLHDDVVDESTLRHGRETANEIWGAKASILVGDYLYTQSIQLLVSIENWPITRLLANTSHQLTCGEVKQLANCHNYDLTVEEYFDIIRAKTAILFATSSAIGALLVPQSGKEVENKLYTYGLHLGTAFQLIDDALDYCADTLTIGKNIGDDLADGKMTLPLLYALKQGTPSQQEFIKRALGNRDLSQLPEITDIIKKNQGILYTRNLAEIEIEKAIQALTILPETMYKNALIELATYAISRTH